MADPLFRKTCISCAKEIIGRPIELNPPDPVSALCRKCNAEQSTPAASGSEVER